MRFPSFIGMGEAAKEERGEAPVEEGGGGIEVDPVQEGRSDEGNEGSTGHSDSCRA